MLHSRRRTLETQKMLGEGAQTVSSPGRAPCVLAMHGFTGTASELGPLLDALVADGRAVEAPLMPGHGASADALQDQTFDDWAAAMRAHARAAVRRHGSVVLLGFSMGSLVAMHLAAERPPGLAGLIVLGNALTLHAYARLPFAVVDRFGWTMPDLFFVKVRAADMRDRAAAAKIATYDRHPMRAAHEVYRAGQRVRREVARIACPTLILHGRHDHVCPPKNARWLAENIGAADVTVHEYANSAHMVAADHDRNAVARDVLAFLARR